MSDATQGVPRRDLGRLLTVAAAVLLPVAVGGYAVVAGRGEGRQADSQSSQPERSIQGSAKPEVEVAPPPTPADVPRAYAGTVIELATPTGEPGIALVADDGSARPLVEDDGSRMLFQDGRLRDRPVRLTALSGPGARAPRVILVQTVTGGQVFDADYWCDVCQISLTHPGRCFCCNEETVLRERPAH